MKKSTAIAAAVMAAAGGKPLFVFASRKDDITDDDKQTKSILSSTEYTKFSCNACGTHVHARSGTSPFCITCGAGSGSVIESSGVAKVSPPVISDLVSLVCSVCDHSTVVEATVATKLVAASGGSVHCSCCGKPMLIKSGMEDGGTSDSPLKTPDTPEPPEEFPAVTADSFEEDDVDLNSLDDAGEVLDEVKATSESNGEGSNADEMPPKKDGETSVESMSDQVLTTPDTPDDVMMDDTLEFESFSMDEDPMDEVLETELPATTEELEEPDSVFDLPEMEGDPLVDALELDDTEVALAFVRANGRVLAVKGHAVVAAFTRKSAGKNFSLANSDVLHAAAIAAVKASGLRKGLSEVGFELLKVPTQSTAVMSRKVQEVTASFQRKDQERQKEFASIFALAAAGLTRGNWKGFSNPIRAALERELTNMGVQGAKRVTASILEQSSIQYAETLLNVSNKLAAMSASARKELAAMLDMTEVTASTEDQTEDTVPSELEARFDRPALLRANVTSTAAGISGASEILAGKAPLNFASV